MTAIVEVSGLRKQYRSRRGGAVMALDGLDLSVPAGGVFGFLGPNGSGKTTTIRCMLGLARHSGGSCRVLGADVPGDLSRVIGRVGALVETPGLSPGLTGRQSLRILATMAKVGRARVEEVLDIADLTNRADHRVKGYSLGMRQRLGIAVALLKDPELLVLDEPVNGLDPAGIREVRLLIRRLGDEGRTVFLSSHLLAEVAQVCDRVAIVAHGRSVTEGSVAEVLSAGRVDRMLVRVGDLAAGLTVLTDAGMSAALTEGGLIRVDLPAAGAEAVTRALVKRRLYPTELRPEEANLEDVFLRLTGEGADGGGGT